jgi:hypothetical protein
MYSGQIRREDENHFIALFLERWVFDLVFAFTRFRQSLPTLAAE